MKISLNLLKTFLPIERDIDGALTMIGHEVESVREFKDPNIVIGRIEKLEMHPNANRLTYCRVDIGSEMLNIVCGAKNHREGDLVAVAKIGAEIGGVKIERRELRGLPSEGMLCSTEELGFEPSDGIMILDSRAPIGEELYDYLFNGDTLYDLSITPNRSDVLSHFGLARDLSVYLKTPLKEYIKDDNVAFNPNHFEGSDMYRAIHISNVKVKESPRWLKSYLREFGIKSINSLVDISNFVMMELGHPTHMFDTDKLEGDIHVRSAKVKEKMVGLDGEEYTLDSSDLVVADSRKAVAIAGIMGSMDSGISADTENIILEIGHFDEKRVRRTSKKLNLSTEASYRFERGVDINSSENVLKRVLSLIEDLSGFSSVEEILTLKNSRESRDIEIDIDEMNSFLGSNISVKGVVEILRGLNMNPTLDGSVVKVVVPSYRLDLHREVDIYEEVARFYGYNNIIEKMPNIRLKVNSSSNIIDDLKDDLVSLGLSEVINYSFVPKGYGSLEISNPINEEFAVMRDSLIYSLSKNVQFNLNSSVKSISIFEIAKIFREREEKLKLAIAISGERSKSLWSEGRDLDFYDMKSILEALANKRGWSLNLKATSRDSLHPYRAVDIEIDGRTVGFMGELSSEYMKLKRRVYILEMDIVPKNSIALHSISKYPAVDRELALLFKEEELVGDALREICIDSMVKSYEILDIYRGENIPKGLKSVAFKFTLQGSGTLSEDEIIRSVSNILEIANIKYGAKLREL